MIDSSKDKIFADTRKLKLSGVYFANKKHGCILIVNEFQNMAALQHLVDFKRDFIGQISQAESV